MSMQSHRSHDSPERAALRRRAAHDTAHDPEAEHGATKHPLVALQQQVGNAQVARMLAQREGEEEEEGAGQGKIQAQHDLAQREGEEEEEGAGQGKIQAQHDLAQREGEEEEEGAGQGLAQAKPEVGLEGGPLSADLSGRINAKRGTGASLDSGTRATMEQSFGTSFEDVRVHTDGESDALNRGISAKAFTTGSDIFFRKDTSPGDHSLLAHELTHVVQQRSSGGSGGGMTVGPAGDSHEQQADSVSSAVTSGAAAQAQRESDEAQAQRMLAQRQGEEEEEMAE
jgi:hypothetical protein